MTGEASTPVVELFDSPDEGLIFSVASAASSAQQQQQPQTQLTPEQSQPENQTQPSQPLAQQDDEPIELVVTGEQDGYRVPEASTATKTDTPLRDIPASVDVVPRQLIQDRQVTRVQQATDTVAGRCAACSELWRTFQRLLLHPGLYRFHHLPRWVSGFWLPQPH
ncbi:hypothetical protein [Nostoc sp. ChiQUE01b]|uniref:hypothetical protein n=1 Tax=Nostoc sp. ChiQUE01b TaxID=3075376 RepID=UPI002AD37091|nr:hypothetical protein [Nostoc sp. ChiQUE01b]MDZ8261521.1 hypothetical protein [Nostoc sp. ChiQUE01b]